jgi:hypothetical protein
MGMCAEIIAIGPYSSGIAKFLNYPAELFANTRPGTVVSSRLFGIAEGSSLSREFAAFLGISDPWDFNQHKIDAARIDLAGLRLFGQVYEEYNGDVTALLALLMAGFEFHFRPEG